jgi:hypothetical protein
LTRAIVRGLKPLELISALRLLRKSTREADKEPSGSRGSSPLMSDFSLITHLEMMAGALDRRKGGKKGINWE